MKKKKKRKRKEKENKKEKEKEKEKKKQKKKKKKKKKEKERYHEFIWLVNHLRKYSFNIHANCTHQMTCTNQLRTRKKERKLKEKT